MQEPLYLIGLASDGKVPQIPTGILDGGDFLWSTDHVAAVAAAAAAHEKQTERVRIVLQEEIARRGQRIDEIERSRRELQTLSNEAHASLEDARRQLGASENLVGATRSQLSEAHAQLEGLTSRLGQRNADVKMLDGQLAELRTQLAAASAALGRSGAPAGRVECSGRHDGGQPLLEAHGPAAGVPAARRS